MPGTWWRGQAGDGEFEVVGFEYGDGTRLEWPGTGNISPDRLEELLREGTAASLIIEFWPEGDREKSVIRTVHFLPGQHSMKTILKNIRIAAARYGITLGELEDDTEILESAGE